MECYDWWHVLSLLIVCFATDISISIFMLWWPCRLTCSRSWSCYGRLSVSGLKLWLAILRVYSIRILSSTVVKLGWKWWFAWLCWVWGWQNQDDFLVGCCLRRADLRYGWSAVGWAGRQKCRYSMLEMIFWFFSVSFWAGVGKWRTNSDDPFGLDRFKLRKIYINLWTNSQQ